MRAGVLDRRIELQKFALSTDGDPTTGTWTTKAEVWAQKMEKGEAERFVSQREIATASRAYKIRYPDSSAAHSGIDPTWRLKEGDEVWDITGTPEGEGRKEEMILVVERFDPDDE